jgi:hypothetical protein
MALDLPPRHARRCVVEERGRRGHRRQRGAQAGELVTAHLLEADGVAPVLELAGHNPGDPLDPRALVEPVAQHLLGPVHRVRVVQHVPCGDRQRPHCSSGRSFGPGTGQNDVALRPGVIRGTISQRLGGEKKPYDGIRNSIEAVYGVPARHVASRKREQPGVLVARSDSWSLVFSKRLAER